MQPNEKAHKLAEALLKKKGEDVVLLDVAHLVDYTDHFLIATGSNAPHLQAMLSELEAVAAQEGLSKTGVEGGSHANWVLVDFGDIVVHLFLADSRGFYDLDGLWSDAGRVEFDGHDDEAADTAAARAR